MKTKPNFANVLLTLLVMMTMVLSAAQPVNVSASSAPIQGDGIERGYHPQTGKLSFLGANPGNPIRVGKAMEGGLSPEARGFANLERYAGEFGIRDVERELTVMRTSRGDGRQRVRYQQVFNGIPVMAGELNVNMQEDGSLLSINGEVSPDLKVDTRSRLIGEAAKRVALQVIGETYNLGVNELTVSEPELWIFDERLMQEKGSQPVQLVWRMEVSAENAPLRELVLVNAQTGKVSLHFNQIDTAWTGNPVDREQDEDNQRILPPMPNDESGSASLPVVPEKVQPSVPEPSVRLLPGITLYVSTSGSDATNNCQSSLTPCQTMKYAVSQAVAGDTIRVTEGTYTGSGTEVVFINKSIDLSGGWNPTFDAQTGLTTVDGENARKGIHVGAELYPAFASVSIDHFAFIKTINGGVTNAENLTIRQSTFHDNSNSAIYQYDGVLTLINSTISNNNGLGVANIGSTVNLRFVTISNNHSVDNAGIYNYGGITNFDHTILYNNSSTPGGGQCTAFNSGVINSLGYNIVETTCITATEQPTDHFTTDPKLSAFLPIQGYQPLLSDSPAIDAGDDLNCEMADQRGMARYDVGGDGTACDIGAYEYTLPGPAASIWASEGNNQHTNPGAGYSLPLTAVVLDSQGTPVSGVNVTFTAPNSGPSGIFTATASNIEGNVVTDSGGAAISSAFTANSELGTFTVSADASLGITADFSLENLAWYVSPTGNDANSCKSPGESCATIKAAVTKAFNGDHIFVATGTYLGTYVEVVPITKSVHLSGGWDDTFTTQAGLSVIDGEHRRAGLTMDVRSAEPSSIDHFAVVNSTAGMNISRGTLLIRNSSFHHNDGTGIFNSSTSLLLENVTISNNGGMGISNGGQIALTNVTISENGETGFRHVSGTSTIRNSIIFGNATNSTTYDCLGPTSSGSIISEGNNIIGNTAGCSITPAAGDQFNSDAGLAIFLPVYGYQPLLSTSPAIDNGNTAFCPALDQRGTDRLGDALCDIGAYEFKTPGPVSSLTIQAGDNQRLPVNQTFPVQFSILALDDSGSPVLDVSITFTAPASGASGTFAGGTTLITGEAGIVTAPVYTANNEPGAYQIHVDAGTTSIDISAENGGWYVSQSGSDANTCTSAGDACASISAVLGKAGFRKGDTILVEQGIYTITGTGYIVTIQTDARLQGGWDTAFTAQVGFSILDGQARSSGLKVESYINAWVDHFIIVNGRSSSGSGIYNVGTLYFSYGSVNNNYSTSSGGGIWNWGKLLSLSNVTVSQNTSVNNGAGIYNGTKVIMKHVTVSLNISTEGAGGGYYRGTSTATATIENSILADNFASGQPSDCTGSLNSAGNNIVKGWTSCTILDVKPGDQLNADPLLGTFLPRQGYQPLTAASPAIDAGNPAGCLSDDQRFVARPQGAGCDIGAYEYKAPGTAVSLSPVSIVTNQRINITESPAIPLQVVALDADGSPVPGTEVTFTAPASGPGGHFTDTGSNVSDPILTDLNGLAINPYYVANIELGSYSIIASATGISPIGISLTNVGWFVSPTGSDLNSCDSKSAPCLTLDGAIMKVNPGEIILAAEGMYTNTTITTTSSNIARVATIDKNLSLSGGWDTAFTVQTGYSTINGQFARRGVVVKQHVTASISRFRIINGLPMNTDGLPMGGGGIQSEGDLTINDSLIYNNIASGGGGVANSGIMVINRSLIYGNKAGGSVAGGVYNGGTMTIRDSAIFNNQALTDDIDYGGGGGLFNSQGTTELYNTSIVNNSSKGRGGGIGVSLGNLLLYNVTISGNTAQEGGGIHNSPGYPGTILMRNTILAGNAASVLGADCLGQVVSKGYNLLGTTSGCTIIQKAGDKFGINPNLGTFLPALGYQPLLGTSQAIDAGDPLTCTATDQRGIARPQGAACDMGAYEYTAPLGAFEIAVADGDGQHAAPGEIYNTPLRSVVLDINGSPVPGESVTFTAPISGAGGVFSGTTTVVTDASGIATAPDLLANTETGPFSVSASLEAGSSVQFNLRNFLVYVKLTGIDQNECLTIASACATIRGGLSVWEFQPGDKILVAAGDYSAVDSFPVLNADARISGGWNDTFTEQTGLSRFLEAIKVGSAAEVRLERLWIEGYNDPYTLQGVVKNLGNLSLYDSTFRNNNTYGIINEGTLLVERMSLSNMKRGIYNFGTATVINATISGNSDYGILNYMDAQILVKNSTIAYNTGANGGGFNAYDGGFRLANSIVANNTSTIVNNGDCSGLVVSDGHNLIGNIGRDLNGNGYFDCMADWSAFDLIGYVTNKGVSHKINPMITPLVERPAGSSIWVHPLLLSSLAIDNGNEGTPGSIGYACPATDQLGTPRPQGGGCDIGAFEYKFGAYPVNPLLVTYTAKNKTTLPGTKICENSTATCPTTDNHAKKAHLNAFSTYSLYKTWHARESLDGQGFQLMSAVHFGSGYGNAFWNGRMMVYGDKYGFALADDVVAHELTHGVTQFESNLFYWYQSGAINESLSDIWGEAVDQANNIGNDSAGVKWQLGEDITGLGAIRSMSNPPAYWDPDSMASVYYCDKGECLEDNGGVHINSGVNNKAAYLMVNGGTFGGKNVRALGWTKTLTIYYEAQTNLLTSGSDYLDLHNALYQACKNKVGTNGITLLDCTEVRDATLAVKMSGQPATNFNPDVALCPAGTNAVLPGLFFDDFETGTDGWTLTAQVGQSAWGISGNNARSGTASLWANDIHETTDSYAATKAIPLPAGSKPYLHFSQTFNFEVDGTSYYDGGVLEYSINNGKTWVDAKPLFNAGRNYTGTIKAGTDNPLRGRMGFVGASHGYVDSRYNLATFAGKTVRFRWRMGTDTAVGVRGWHVDNVRIYLCVGKPGVPTLISPANTGTLANLQPSFDWSDSNPDLAYYQLQLATNNLFTENMVSYTNITVSTHTLTSDLNPATEYFWRVRAFNAANKPSAWSVVWSFRTPP